MEREVWTYVAHKDGMFAGAISGTLDVAMDRKPTKREAAQWKKEVAKFCGGFIANGFTITPTYSAEEATALTKDMPMWKRPPKLAQAPETGDLFA